MKLLFLWRNLRRRRGYSLIDRPGLGGLGYGETRPHFTHGGRWGSFVPTLDWRGFIGDKKWRMDRSVVSVEKEGFE